jgi:hypothetical protein
VADRGGDLGAVLGLGEVEAVARNRRAAAAVEGIGHEHDIALRGQPLAQVAEHRAQALVVGPDQHRRPLAPPGRMKQRRVADAVGGLDVDALLDGRFRRVGVGHAKGGDRGGRQAERPARQARLGGGQRGIGILADVVVAHGVRPSG